MLCCCDVLSGALPPCKIFAKVRILSQFRQRKEQNLKLKKIILLLHFRLFIIFYVNLHNFLGGRENSGTPFPFVEKSNFYIFGRVYEILPPHSLIGTISKLFPKISRWRLPWGKGTKNLLCFSVFIKQHIFSGHLFCKSANILNALILYPAFL